MTAPIIAVARAAPSAPIASGSRPLGPAGEAEAEPGLAAALAFGQGLQVGEAAGGLVLAGEAGRGGDRDPLGGVGVDGLLDPDDARIGGRARSRSTAAPAPPPAPSATCGGVFGPARARLDPGGLWRGRDSSASTPRAGLGGAAAIAADPGSERWVPKA